MGRKQCRKSVKEAIANHQNKVRVTVKTLTSRIAIYQNDFLKLPMDYMSPELMSEWRWNSDDIKKHITELHAQYNNYASHLDSVPKNNKEVKWMLMFFADVHCNEIENEAEDFIDTIKGKFHLFEREDIELKSKQQGKKIVGSRSKFLVKEKMGSIENGKKQGPKIKICKQIENGMVSKLSHKKDVPQLKYVDRKKVEIISARIAKRQSFVVFWSWKDSLPKKKFKTFKNCILRGANLQMKISLMICERAQFHQFILRIFKPKWREKNYLSIGKIRHSYTDMTLHL